MYSGGDPDKFETDANRGEELWNWIKKFEDNENLRNKERLMGTGVIRYKANGKEGHFNI